MTYLNPCQISPSLCGGCRSSWMVHPVMYLELVNCQWYCNIAVRCQRKWATAASLQLFTEAIMQLHELGHMQCVHGGMRGVNDSGHTFTHLAACTSAPTAVPYHYLYFVACATCVCSRLWHRLTLADYAQLPAHAMLTLTRADQRTRIAARTNARADVSHPLCHMALRSTCLLSVYAGPLARSFLRRHLVLADFDQLLAHLPFALAKASGHSQCSTHTCNGRPVLTCSKVLCFLVRAHLHAAFRATTWCWQTSTSCPRQM